LAFLVVAPTCVLEKEKREKKGKKMRQEEIKQTKESRVTIKCIGVCRHTDMVITSSWKRKRRGKEEVR
jgi:hypothetical protein